MKSYSFIPLTALFAVLLGLPIHLFAQSTVTCQHGTFGPHGCPTCANSGGSSSSTRSVPTDPTTAALSAIKEGLDDYNRRAAAQAQVATQRQRVISSPSSYDRPSPSANISSVPTRQYNSESEIRREQAAATASLDGPDDIEPKSGPAKTAPANKFGSTESSTGSTSDKPTWTFGPSGPPKDNGIPSSLWGQTEQIIQPETSSTWRTYKIAADGGIISFNPNTSELARNPVTGQYEAVLREEHLRITIEEWAK